MLERHFRSFKAIDRIKALWLGPYIELYAQSLDEQHTSNATVRQHVRALAHFNDFVLARGVIELQELPDHVDAFVERWKAEHGGWCKSAQDVAAVVAQSRVPVERMLSVALPGYVRPSSKPAMPFSVAAPGFFPFLLDEKGLRRTTLHNYTYTLRPFESYLAQVGVILAELTPAGITGFLNERAKTLHKSGMLSSTGALRVFLRYLVLDRKPHPPNDSRPFGETKISRKTELAALWTGQSTQKRGLCGNLRAQLGLKSIIN